VIARRRYFISVNFLLFSLTCVTPGQTFQNKNVRNLVKVSPDDSTEHWNWRTEAWPTPILLLVSEELYYQFLCTFLAAPFAFLRSFDVCRHGGLATHSGSLIFLLPPSLRRKLELLPVDEVSTFFQRTAIRIGVSLCCNTWFNIYLLGLHFPL
jgi:hypothetical protein